MQSTEWMPVSSKHYKLSFDTQAIQHGGKRLELNVADANEIKAKLVVTSRLC